MSYSNSCLTIIFIQKKNFLHKTVNIADGHHKVTGERVFISSA